MVDSISIVIPVPGTALGRLENPNVGDRDDTDDREHDDWASHHESDELAVRGIPRPTRCAWKHKVGCAAQIPEEHRQNELNEAARLLKTQRETGKRGDDEEYRTLRR